MKILANDGISESGKNLLLKNGFEVITENVPQENLITQHLITLLFQSLTKMETSFPGPLRERKDSKDQENQHLMQLKLQLMMLELKPLNRD
jgi:hypothetical protein